MVCGETIVIKLCFLTKKRKKVKSFYWFLYFRKISIRSFLSIKLGSYFEKFVIMRFFLLVVY